MEVCTVLGFGLEGKELKNGFSCFKRKEGFSLFCPISLRLYVSCRADFFQKSIVCLGYKFKKPKQISPFCSVSWFVVSLVRIQKTIQENLVLFLYNSFQCNWHLNVKCDFYYDSWAEKSNQHVSLDSMDPFYQMLPSDAAGTVVTGK